MTGQERGDSGRSRAGRRRFLSAVGAAAVSGLAGCSADLLDGVTGTDASASGTTGEAARGDAAGTAHRMDGPKEEHDGWPRYHYDSWNTGHRTEPVGFDGAPTIEWETEVGGVNTIVADGGTLYLAEGENGAVRALDAASGAEEWVYDAVEKLELGVETVALDDETAYVGGTTAIHAIDRESGQQRWTFDVSTPASAPVVVDGTIYVGAGDVLFAIDAAGDRQWALRTGVRIRNPPAVVDDTLYLTGQAWLIAVDAASGEELWALKPEGATPPVTAPVYRAGRLYVGAPTHVHAYDPAAEGDHLWSTETLNQTVYGSPAVAHGQVFTGVNLVDKLHAFDAESGDRSWQRSITVAGSPVVAGDTVYCVDEEYAELRALGATDGSDRWRVAFDGNLDVQPTVTDDRIYVAGLELGNTDGTLYALGER
jgi:outer membrane protein assembly factor BamB